MDEQALLKVRPHRLIGYQIPGPESQPGPFDGLSIANCIKHWRQEQAMGIENVRKGIRPVFLGLIQEALMN